jgi:galactokinase
VTGPWRLFVPGRLEVFGKHTDYAGGRSLVAALPRGITVTAVPATDGRILVHDADADEQAAFSVTGTGSSLGWRRYPRTVIRRLARNFPHATLSARIELSSDLPQAAGMSSSSALVIAVAEALIACSAIEEFDPWRTAIGTSEDRAAYFGCIENGAPFRTLAGDAGVGTQGGSEDHAAILMSRAGHLQQFSFSPLRLDHAVRMPEGWTFVIASTGIAARKTGDARDDYNRAAAAAAAIVRAAVAAGFSRTEAGGAAGYSRPEADVAAGYNRTRADVAAGVSRPDAGIAAGFGPTKEDVAAGVSRPEAPVRDVRTELTLADFAMDAAAVRKVALPPHLRARLEHFVAEDARVLDAAAAFERGDIARVRELAEASQRDAERLLCNQVPETSDMVSLAREVGAAAASGFGAGWGGSVWSLVPGPDAETFLQEWLRAYRTRHPALPSVGFVSPPGAGMIRQ